jgi:hypothetical protein
MPARSNTSLPGELDTVTLCSETDMAPRLTRTSGSERYGAKQVAQRTTHGLLVDNVAKLLGYTWFLGRHYSFAPSVYYARHPTLMNVVDRTPSKLARMHQW